jgi:hypothetical protein
VRPGGGLALINTVPDWSETTWAHGLGTLVSGTRPEHPHFDGPPWQDAVRAAAGWTEPWEVRVTASRPAQPERIVDWMGSISWIAGLPDEERAAFLAKVRELVQEGASPAELPIHFEIGLARRSS